MIRSFHLHIRAQVSVAISLVTLALFSAGLNAAHFRFLEGETEGPHAVLIMALPPHAQSLGVADQVATVPLQKGRLSIIETHGDPSSANAASLLAGIAAVGDDQPDWVWVFEGVGDVETVAIATGGPRGESVSQAVQGALAPEVELDLSSASARLERTAREGVTTVQYSSRIPVSRQNRYSRNAAIALLKQAGMVADESRFEWDRLTANASNLVAIYDAEGVGEAGAQNLERITASRIDGAGVYRVCGEDIREGALAPAKTAIFPGGSGRGIGNGLQDEGRDILREYVSGGGGYLGVCAGAYFAGSGLENYLCAIDLRHSAPWQRGRGIVQMELTPEGRKLFGDDQPEIIHTRYANGPVFLPEDQEGEGDPNFVVLARFTSPSTDRQGVVRDEMVGQAAVGAMTYGDGRLLIISPHPESHAEHYGLVARAISWTMGID